MLQIMSDGKVTLTSEYLEASNRLYPSTSKRNIQVFVEGDPDVRFWAPLFNRYNDKYNININRAFEVPANDGKAANGCSRIANLINTGQLKLGKNLIVCLDSDYRFILNDYKDGYEFVPNNEYVLETGVCAKENVISAPEGLKEIVQKSVSLTTWFPNLDFRLLFKSLSRSLFILQSLQLYYIRNDIGKVKAVNQKLINELTLLQEKIHELNYTEYEYKHFSKILRELKKESLIFFKSNLKKSERKDFSRFLIEIHSRMEGYDNAIYFVRGHDFNDFVLKELIGRGSYLLLEQEKQRRIAMQDKEGVAQLYKEAISAMSLVQCREDYSFCRHFKNALVKADAILAA